MYPTPYRQVSVEMKVSSVLMDLWDVMAIWPVL